MRNGNPVQNQQRVWEVGTCGNCSQPLRPTRNPRPSLFCSESCRSYAESMRYFRGTLRDGRILDPDVRVALQTRMAFLVVGGYDHVERRLPRRFKAVVLSANDGLCVGCNLRPATEVDHIEGASGDRANLQGLCHECHTAKTAESFVPMSDAHRLIRDQFLQLVWRNEPLMAAHDEQNWSQDWRALVRQTRAWADQELAVRCSAVPETN